MKRIAVFALVASLAHASAALAGESLVSSGTRHVQQLAITEAVGTTGASVVAPKTSQPLVAGQRPAASLQDQVPNLSKSGMGKGKKWLLFIGLGVGAAASMYAIDQHVVDVTPSSQGKRQD
jgi:hypothetical protein